MPTYVYRREDGTKFEIKQRITDDPLETCPETGQPVTRIISGSAGLIFKGSGFYETDYKRKDAANGRESTSNGSATNSGSATNGTTASEATASGSDTSSTGDASKASTSESGTASSNTDA